MRTALGWKDFEIIDASDGERLERWGDILLIRPDPQVIWKTERKNTDWKNAHGRYHRSTKGGGEWEWLKKVPDFWKIRFELSGGDPSKIAELCFNIKPMSFKHTGIFPEQAVNWNYMYDKISRKLLKLSQKGNTSVGTSERLEKGGEVKPELRILNLFGYTGAATLACVAAGAHVTHVDASKGMVLWGQENAELSGLRGKPMRWLVDDCVKFIRREIRRGSTYHGVIMDPPSYGRGPSGEIWKIEDNIFELIQLCSEILDKNALFLLINSYTAGLSPSVMQYMLAELLCEKFGGAVSSDEIGLPVSETGLVLPCGSSAIWER